MQAARQEWEAALRGGMYFVAINRQQAGPYPIDQLSQMLQNRTIDSATLVWKEGMPNWQPLSSVPELAALSTGPAAPTGGLSLSKEPAPPNFGAGVPQQSPIAPPTGYPQSSDLSQAYGSGQSPYAAPRTNPTGNQAYVGPKPTSYLWQSIVCTLLCCLPLGIVSIVYAAKVDSAYAQGDYQAAVKASNSAKTWVVANVIVTSVLSVIALLAGAFS